MKYAIPTRTLPDHADLDQLKRQAKELLEEVRAGDTNAVAEVHKFYRDADLARFALHDAQLVLARSYGFDSWPKLKAYVDGVTIRRLVDGVKAGDVERVRAIVRVRPELVNWEAPGSQGHMPLHYAVLGQMAEMVRVLMQAGANPHTTTAGIYALRDAATPMAIAVERGYGEIAGILREEEARRKPPAETPPAGLRRALESGDEDTALGILERHPALVRAAVSDRGWTALHAASALLLPRVAAWLLDHGADANRAADDGRSPLDVCGRYGGSGREEDIASMAELLRTRGAILSPRSAVILGDVEFLRRQTDLITPRDGDGWLLALAVDHDQPAILRLLLDLGLDPDARVRVDGEDTVTFTWGMPLYQCARTGKHAMAQVLLEHGADPNGQVYASGTPLSEAYGQRDEEMISLLERYGGKSNASMAGLYRRADLAKRLLEEFGDTPLPDDGFSSGPVVEQLLGAAARGGDPEILRMAMERVNIPHGDPRWNGLLQGPLGFWNHWIGPWCHPEWDRTTYLACFKMILERSGPPNAALNCGATILHQIVVMGAHVTTDERLQFAIAALDAGARLDLRDDLLRSTPLGWACRWGRAELVQLLLERGADPVEPDAEPWASPLAWAVKKGHASIAEMLRNSAQHRS